MLILKMLIFFDNIFVLKGEGSGIFNRELIGLILRGKL